MTVKNLIPVLPAAAKVSDKPVDLECFSRSKLKWVPVIETLKVIDACKCVEWDIKGLTDNQIIGMKTGIKSTAKKLNFKYLIKFAIKEDSMTKTLFIWSNR